MTQRLSTNQVISARLTACRMGGVVETIQQLNEIDTKIKVFEATVWFPRLQAQVNGTGARGMRGDCRGVKVLTWCCAGRCLIQLEDQGDRITLITADDEAPWNRDNAHVAPGMGPMGLQSIDAEFVQALTMLYKVTRYGEEITLVRDDNVTIGD